MLGLFTMATKLAIVVLKLLIVFVACFIRNKGLILQYCSGMQIEDNLKNGEKME